MTMNAAQDAVAEPAQPIDREAYKAKLLSKLNERQRVAVSLGAESALVLAGAGSGKTTLLISRIAHLVADRHSPRHILAVTFTNKAGEEMKTRLRKVLPREDVSNLWVGTFHSLCNRILRENSEAAGLPPTFAILDNDGQEAVIKTVMRELGLLRTPGASSAAAPPPSPDVLPDDETSQDSGDGNKLKPSEVMRWINGFKERGLRLHDVEAIGERQSQMFEVWKGYMAHCSRQGLLDFNDLLYKTVSLLRSEDRVRRKYADRFTSILVDEFQDTNEIQYEWLQLMRGPRSHVMAVGDDAQSIYAFRGANPKNMQRFVSEMTCTPDHPKGRIIKLEQNYRSKPYILEAANAIIANNTDQIPKALFTMAKDGGETIPLVEYANGYEEAAATARKVHHLMQVDKVPASEIAILYRTNAQSRQLEQELNKLGVPLTVYGGFRFYERQEVKNVIAYLDLLSNIDRDVSFARIVNFPLRGIGERSVEALRQQARDADVSMMEMIGIRAGNPDSIKGAVARKQQNALEKFAADILTLAEMAHDIPLSDLVKKMIVAVGIEAHYAAEAGPKSSEREEREQNLAELVSAIRQFEIEHPELQSAAECLPDYLSNVQLMASTSEADMNKKATVSLMTVHSSKGLEFDHVFIAGMEEGLLPHKNALGDAGKSLDEVWSNADPFDLIDEADGGGPSDREETAQEDTDEMREERRLMYVAVTRARAHLELSYATSRMLNGKEASAEKSRFIAEIPEHRIAFERARHGSSSPDDAASGAKQRVPFGQRYTSDVSVPSVSEPRKTISTPSSDQATAPRPRRVLFPKRLTH